MCKFYTFMQKLVPWLGSFSKELEKLKKVTSLGFVSLRIVVQHKLHRHSLIDPLKKQEKNPDMKLFKDLYKLTIVNLDWRSFLLIIQIVYFNPRIHLIGS